MINIAKLLKDAPEGMKLYSPLFGEVEFAEVMDTGYVPIRVMKRGYGLRFDKYGRYMGNEYPDSECLLFPSKDYRTWQGWTPCVEPKFKVGDWIANDYCAGKVIALTDDAYLLDSGQGIPFSCEHNAHLWTIADAKNGDVLAADECYVIFKEIDGLNIKCYCTYHYMGFNPSFHIDTLQNKAAFNPATKEQRDTLFAKMKEYGYEWDEKKKELHKIINPKFKVGDEIKTGNTIETIAEVGHAIRSYYCESGRTIYFANQDLWHLVPKPHYDIKNFKPFDKVLVRSRNDEPWRIAFYGYYNEEAHYSHFVGTCWSKQCIPFEGNETLLGTTDMCDERFINW